jgi:hypothetical protein
VPLNSRHAILAVLLVIACVAAACGGARGGSMSPRSRTVISLEEIERARQDGVRDLYELIERLQPRWLQIRNPRSLELPTVIAVYHNGTLLGGIDVLRSYQLVSVTSIRYLDAAQAMLLPGAGSAHIQSAIVFSTAVVPDTSSAPLPTRLIRGGT